MASTRCSHAGIGEIGPEEIVCSCLRVTAGELTEALETEEIRTLKDIRRETGAGGGCMVCHRLLRKYLERYAYASSPSSSSLEPICSDR
jgi:NAD(P)H-nitrite reductase large subunit